jgi:hypothetical protein
MAEKNEIGTITLKIDQQQLRKIATSGRLEKFIEKATELFKRDLKAELVKESVSSSETALFLYDDEFGTGPRPPHWHNIARIELLTSG